MASLKDVIKQLEINNKKTEKSNDLMAEEIKRDQEERKRQERERIIADKDDKKGKKGLLSRTISKSLNQGENKVKGILGQFIEPFLNFLGTTIGLAALDFFSKEENMTKFRNAVGWFAEKISTFIDVIGEVTGKLMEGDLKGALNSVFSEQGAVAAGVLLAATALLSPLRFLRKSFKLIGGILKGAAGLAAGLAGLAAPKFSNLDDIAERRYRELVDADKRGTTFIDENGNKKINVLNRNTGQIEAVDYYDKNGKPRIAATTAENARQRRLEGYRTQSAQFAADEDAKRGKESPKTSKMLGRVVKLLGIFGAIAGTALTVQEINSVAENPDLSDQEKKAEITRILGRTLGGLGGAALVASLGGMAGGPLGALAGGIGGYFAGEHLGEIAANYIVDGTAIQRGSLPSDNYVSPATDEYSGLENAGNPTQPLAPLSSPGPALTPTATALVNRTAATGNTASIETLNRTANGIMSSDIAIKLLMSIDDSLASMGVGAAYQQNNVVNNQARYFLPNAGINTSPPNR